MFVNASHPRFSIVGEVLCMLSQWESPIKWMAADLKLENGHDVRAAIAQLQREGIEVITERHSDGLGIAARLMQRSVKEVRKRAETYWGAVYGD